MTAPDQEPEKQQELEVEAVQEPVDVQPNYQELYVRLLAEQENLRKRLETDKQQFAKFAQMGAAESLIPIVDNFYRATDHIPDAQKQEGWIVGIMHIQKQLLDCLESWGVTEIPAKPGDAFDAALHEAIGTAVDESVAEDHIISIQNRGYKLHGRVLRPVQVTTSIR